ncbi:hypothetical protein BC826DRAFT_22709 [Russula brevipes]|nr:hypothetical protein BC826DRAFT_22709 [Russula brevipes]
MMINTLALFAGLVSLSSAAASVINVTVSNAQGGLVYDPQYTNATINDIIVFTFASGNHTVTESVSIDKPCTYKDGGFDSGFNFFVNATDTNSTALTFNLTVNSTEPIYLYCKQAANTSKTHCGKGMVFAVNSGANGTNTSFSVFQQNALAVGAALNSTNGTNSTGTSSAPASTGTSASHNGATSFNVGAVMLMAAVGASFGLMA